ncbi:hypothetical protein LUZ63_004415 [Rhynchospora breviuscula]|uniref:Reverse transcriptase zinc-binding domain-containing protein n=1 Tax=Rhynchospora breviuscula TaxID=2022672 RepID=A0A9Q0HZZ2_9POAL|nr:hypothetical protein LUZ63_004415 [Rhynchospora breviuscula]
MSTLFHHTRTTWLTKIGKQCLGEEAEQALDCWGWKSNAILWHSIFTSPLTELQTAYKASLDGIVLSRSIDRLAWKWTTHGNFSVASTYKALILAGTTRFACFSFWKLKVPPTVKLFLVLLAQDKLSTQEQLLRRKMSVPVGCSLCGNSDVETALHIFFECPFIARISSTPAIRRFCPSIYSKATIKDSMMANLAQDSHSSTSKVYFATTLYAIWMERNNRLFRGIHKSQDVVAHSIMAESSCFLRFCT